MKYLLDTCVLSELTRPRPEPSVVAWLRAVDPDELGISVLTLGELEKGVERLRAGKRRVALRAWLDELLDMWVDRIFAITAPIAIEWGRVAASSEARGDVIPVVDALIGATAKVHSLVVVTRNGSDLARTGAPILDPWP